MRSLHLEKKGLRGLAIAESFKQKSKNSVLSGVIMRRDFVIDGFVFGSTTINGDDATDVVLRMYEEIKRPDVSYLLISGLIISMYNVVDIRKIHETLELPIIGVSYNESQGIEEAIKNHFPEGYLSKIKEYQKLGDREKISLKTSSDIYVRREGCSLKEVELLLNELTLHGSYPEPIRVAQLLAKSLLQKGLSF